MRAEMSNLNERLPSMEASAELLRPLSAALQPDDPSALSGAAAVSLAVLFPAVPFPKPRR